MHLIFYLPYLLRLEMKYKLRQYSAIELLCIIFVLYFIYSSFNIIFDLQDSRTVVFLLLFQHDESAWLFAVRIDSGDHGTASRRTRHQSQTAYATCQVSEKRLKWLSMFLGVIF